ncbi:MAG: ATP-binding protein [Paracoccaceae bacterium]|jgi:two-component system nitrogen regulation sensor histidine kinase GlnL|nr:ATP-binding protein [Paracoccaceae bacterium]
MPGSGRIWASLPMPALVLDEADRITAINPAAEEFLNTTIRSVAGELVYDRLAIDAAIEEALSRVRRNRAPLFINDVAVGTGERAPVAATIQIAPMADKPEAGRLLFVFTPREIAGRLGRSAHSDAAAKSAVGMAEMLAHEIKNPLAGIAGAAQLLSMNLENGDRELCDLIVEETRRVSALLEQVEQFGNMRPPELRPINIHDVLDRARKSALVGFAAHMTIREDYDPSLPPAQADPDQLLQIFQNLMKNAAEAAERSPRAGAGRTISGQSGEIRLRTFYDSSLRVRGRDGTPARLPLQVEIVDDGPGLPPGIAADIFEPFVSGRENGTGLGLALVSKIVADHGAFISVDSAPGRTAFRLSLPVAPEGAARPPTSDDPTR